MKRNTIPKSVMAYLIIGLIFTSLTPIISRYYPVPDLFKGLITGLGLTLEVIAIIKIQRIKGSRICRTSDSQDS